VIPAKTFPPLSQNSGLKHFPRGESRVLIDGSLQIVFGWIRIEVRYRYEGSLWGQNDRTIVSLAPHGTLLPPKEPVQHMSRFGFKAAHECIHVVGINDCEKQMQMGRLYHEVADLHRVKLHCSSEAAFYDSLAEGVSQKQQTLLNAERAKKHAPVGVIFHFLSRFSFCHEVVIVQDLRKLLFRAKKLASVEKNSSPGTVGAKNSSPGTVGASGDGGKWPGAESATLTASIVFCLRGTNV
jgi:hypothetical protein